METEAKTPVCIKGSLICAFLTLVGLFIALIICASTSISPFTDMTLVVESTAVKFYNLTVDNRLSWAVDLGIRAHNNRTVASIDLYGYEVEVGKGGSAAHNSQLGLQKSLNLSLCPGCQEVVHAEAVSDGHVELGPEIARELRADVAASEGRFDVFMRRPCETCGCAVDVTCKNVVLGFARLTERRVQKVDCQVMVRTVCFRHPGYIG